MAFPIIPVIVAALGTVARAVVTYGARIIGRAAVSEGVSAVAGEATTATVGQTAAEMATMRATNLSATEAIRKGFSGTVSDKILQASGATKSEFSEAFSSGKEAALGRGALPGVRPGVNPDDLVRKIPKGSTMLGEGAKSVSYKAKDGSIGTILKNRAMMIDKAAGEMGGGLPAILAASPPGSISGFAGQYVGGKIGAKFGFETAGKLIGGRVGASLGGIVKGMAHDAVKTNIGSGAAKIYDAGVAALSQGMNAQSSTPAPTLSSSNAGGGGGGDGGGTQEMIMILHDIRNLLSAKTSRYGG